MVERMVSLGDSDALGEYYRSKGEHEKMVQSFCKAGQWRKLADLVFQ